MNRIPHPIPYQGSKRNIADKILPYFPEKFDRIIEPFTGSAAISIAAAYHKRAKSFWLNDAHEPIVTLWKAILEEPEDLVARYSKLWHDQEGREPEFYNEVRRRFNEKREADTFLFLLARCVKAAIRYNSNGEFNNSPDHRRKGATPANTRLRVMQTSGLLSGKTKLTCSDYRDVLKKAKKSDLIYMDPPYQGVCGKRDSRYAPSVTHAEFCEALADLVEKDALFIVSYDGRTGDKTFGEPMPDSLKLTHIEIDAGVSTQATLLGRNDRTVESLYLSPALAKLHKPKKQPQKMFF